MDAIRHIPDEDAILSVDFLAGFTVFILALIMVVSLVPAVIAGIQSENIDYDAVAYRTSVILVEDPGAPGNPSWNQMRAYDMAHKDDIQRLGLAVSKDTPNILSREKVDKFFNRLSDFTLTADDYRDKVIFGEIPYLYNISLLLDTESEAYYAGGGTEVPTYQYGYMRRLVKVKEPSVAEILFPDYPTSNDYSESLPASENSTTADFAVQIPYEVLIDRSVNPAYRIDPRSEILRINLSNMYSHLNATDIPVGNFTFTGAEINKYVGGGVLIPLLGPGMFDNDTYSLTIDNVPYPANISPPMVVDSSSIEMVLYPPLDFSNEITSSLYVNFSFSYQFNDSHVPHRYISGVHRYDYTANVTQPKLVDGVMEVAIW